jgi:hypothetical protein
MEIEIPEGGLSIHEKISCIYVITNIKNKKMYIGQTVDYRKRSSDYRNAHLHEPLHGMYKVIAEEGTENFKMSILQTCSPRALTRLENYYIKRYQTYDPRFGYNIVVNNKSRCNDVKSRKAKSKSHTGLKESADTKRKKSNVIIAIRNNVAIIADSGKLFGDYVGKSKDYIKNCLRQPSSVRGFRLYYMDFSKRQVIRSKMLKKRSIRDRQYMETLDFLDNLEIEGVETIDSCYDVYYLNYNNVVDMKPILINQKGVEVILWDNLEAHSP